MTDERPEGREAPDPAVERAVAALLRDARETGPIPPEVAARIDGALAREAADDPGAPDARAPGDRVAPVVGLRRRTRRVVLAVGAAAAALVVAVPVAQELAGSGGADSTSSTAGAGAGERAESAQPDDGGEAGADSLAPSLAPSGAPSDGEPDGGDRGLVGPGGEEAQPGAAALLLGADDYDAQVAAFVRAGAVGPPATASCGAPAQPGVRLVAVRLDGVLGALALRAAGDEVATELYLCGGQGPERPLVVPLDASDR